jgi:hypothetical protein
VRFSRDRVKRLEKKREGNRTELTCPQCGWEITVHGDVTLAMLLYDWTKYQWDHGRREYGHPTEGLHPSLVELLGHEHDADDFIEKRSGLNLFDPTISGMNLGNLGAEL